MPLRLSLLALLLCTVAVNAAELKTLKGEVVKGDLVSVDAKEIVLDVAGEKKTFPITLIASIDYSGAAKVPADTKFHDVELVDGTLLHCTSLVLNKDEVTVKLLGSDVEVKMPLSAISHMLRDGHDPKAVADWQKRLGDKATRSFDGVVSNKGELKCTILESDAKGNITFRLQDDKPTDPTYTRPIMSFVGVIFQRKINPNAAPVMCKLLDTGGSTIMVSKVEVKDGALHISTGANVTLIFKAEQMVRLDYSNANVAYLSDLTPTKVKEESTEDRVEHFRKDRNIDDRPIRLLGVVYNKGLGLHSTTELEYKLKGEFRTLQGIAGIDDQVGGHNRPVVLRIYASDGVNPNQDVLLLEKSFTRKKPQERVKDFSVSVKDVQFLKIVVTYDKDDLLDLGLHLDLADIRVVK